jgi:hypothetical protein
VSRRLLCRRASVSCSDLQLEFAQAIARAPAHLCMPACATLTLTPARPPPPHHVSRISRSVDFSRARKHYHTDNALCASADAHQSASLYFKFLPTVTSYATPFDRFEECCLDRNHLLYKAKHFHPVEEMLPAKLGQGI